MRVSLILASILVSAPLFGADEPTDDRDKFVGAWKVVSFVHAGKESLDKDKSMTMKFTRVSVSYASKGNGLKLSNFDDDTGRYTLNQKAKIRTIDIKWGDQDYADLGVYKFDGETLTINLAGPGAEPPRPIGFDNKDRATLDCRLLKLERIPEKK